MDHCKKHQQELNERLRGCYDNIEKGNEDELQKGGEGSKGGKVVGHTTSGKPIYENHDHPEHSKFTAKDHEDAAEKFQKLRNRNFDRADSIGDKPDDTPEKAQKAFETGSKHDEQMKKHKESAKKKSKKK